MRSLPRQLRSLGKQPPRWRVGVIQSVTRITIETGEFSSYAYVASVKLGDGVILNNVGIYGGIPPSGDDTDAALGGCACVVHRFGVNSFAVPLGVSYQN